MRKIWALIAVVIVFVIAVGIASRTASRQAQIAHSQGVQALASAEHVTVLSDSFARGLMDSESEVHLEVAGPIGHWLRAHLERAGLEHARTRFGLRLVTRLDHGPDLAARWIGEDGGGAPIVAVAISELSLDGETARDLAAALGEVPPATFVTDIRLSGLRETSVVWAATELANRTTGVTADWGGLDGLITHVPGGPVRGHVSGNGFGWSGPAGTFAVEGFELDFDGTNDVDGVWSGKLDQRWRGVVWEPAGDGSGAPEASEVAVETEVASSSASDPSDAASDAASDAEEAPASGSIDVDLAEAVGAASNGRWAADDLRVTHEATRTGNELDWRLDLRIAGGAVGGRALESLLGSARLRHLDALAGFTSGNGDGALQSLIGSALPHLVRGPALDPFHIELSGPDGQLKINGSVRVDPEHPAAGNLISAIDALEGQFVLTNEGTLGEVFGLTPEVIAELQSAGLVALSGDAMVAPLSLVDGTLQVAKELVATAQDVTVEAAPDDIAAEPAPTDPIGEAVPMAGEAEGLAETPAPTPELAGTPVAASQIPDAKPPKAGGNDASEDALMAELIAADDERTEAKPVPAAQVDP